jgi:serine-type D-Ala-D-Ala carboxypeptidase/endopeptidase (penicillin-binding protein 4)
MSLIPAPPRTRSTVLADHPVLRSLRRYAALALLVGFPAAAQEPLAGNVADPAGYATSAPEARALASRIDAVLARPHLAQARWGIEVREAGSGRLLYARDADRPMVPASGLKLVVAAAAAHHLEAGHRFRTSLHATGPVRGGVLEGDLVLYGRGDPNFSSRFHERSTEAFEALADSLLALGIRRIAGGVTADESWFDAEHVHGDWNAHDRLWWYAAPVSALGFNDNAVDVRILPGTAAGSPARVTASPASAAYRLENAGRTVARGGASDLTLQRGALPGVIRAVGRVPLGAGARTVHFAVEDPARWTGTVFRETLERKGIAVGRAAVRVVSDPALSPAGDVPALVEWTSAPLDHVVGPVLLRSQNWFAELLVKTLGREVRGAGSWEAGLAVQREFLEREVGIHPGDLVLRDGSGLSSRNRITPRAMTALLEYVRRTPGQEVVRAALPVSGQTGSLERRLVDLPGRVAAKTGYIRGVDALAGYLVLADGREVVFAIFSNESREPTARMKAGIDDVVRAIART